MQHTNKLAFFALFAAVGCIPVDDYDKETGEDNIIDPEPDPVSASVSWGDSSVSLTISNGESGAAYNWGIAENSGSCLTSEWGCWTGEDCHMGFDLTSGGNLTYCHPVSATGGTLTYGAATDAVAGGSTTVFSSADFGSLTTHVLDDENSTEAGTCWTWGADTTYYNGFYKSCEAM